MIRVCVASRNDPYDWESQLVASVMGGSETRPDRCIDWVHDETKDTSNERRGGLRNLWDAIQRADDDDICVLMGGDDYLGPSGLHVVEKAYEDPECWLTYGSCSNTDGSPSHSAPQVHDDVRHHPFVWMPLTCRAWLAKKVLPEDLQIAGWWQWSSGDVALNLPMIEMCGSIKGGHARYIKEEWYVRRVHDQNDHAMSRRLQDWCCWMSRARPKYSALRDRHDTPTRTPHVLRDDLLFKADSQASYMLRRDPAVPIEPPLPPAREPADWKCIPMGDHQLFCVGEPKPEAMEKIKAMAKAMPDGIIALSSPSEAAKNACLKDGIGFYTSADGFSTMGYVMPKQLASQMLEWAEATTNVENPVALFAMAKGRPLWHPVGDPPYESTRPFPHVGRLHSFHWQLITKLKRALPLRAYAVERDTV